LPIIIKIIFTNYMRVNAETNWQFGDIQTSDVSIVMGGFFTL